MSARTGPLDAQPAAKLRPIHLDLGTPSRLPPAQARRTVAFAAERASGYAPPEGLPELRTEIARRLETSWSRAIDPSRIVVTTGASLGLAAVLAAAKRPPGTSPCGDASDRHVVLVPDPGYPAYARLAGIFGLRTLPYDVGGSDGGIGAIDRGLAGASSATVIWNVPHNPTGAIASETDTRKLLLLVAATGATLISDEVYADFAYDRPQGSPAAHGNAHVFTVGSFSKAFALAGLRVGYVACPPGASADVARAQWALAMSPPTIGQAAALACLLTDPSYPDRLRAELDGRRHSVAQACSALGFGVSAPQGGFFLWMTPPAGFGDGDAFAGLAKRRSRVILHPGSAFGERGRPYVRMSFAGDSAELDEAVDRLRILIEWGPPETGAHRRAGAPEGHGRP